MKAIRQEHDNHRRLHLILDELDIETTDFITKPALEQQRLVTEIATKFGYSHQHISYIKTRNLTKVK